MNTKSEKCLLLLHRQPQTLLSIHISQNIFIMTFYIFYCLSYNKGFIMLMLAPAILVIVFNLIRMLMVKIYLSFPFIKTFLNYPAMLCVLTCNLYKSLRFPNYFKICLIYEAFFCICKRIAPLSLFYF